MSPAVAKANLLDAQKKLRLRWAAIRDLWQDDAARRFEEEFILPLEARLNAALKGLDHIEDTLARMRRDCEGGGWEVGPGGRIVNTPTDDPRDTPGAPRVEAGA